MYRFTEPPWPQSGYRIVPSSQKTSSCYSFILTPSPYPKPLQLLTCFPWILFSFWECQINGIIKNTNFLNLLFSTMLLKLSMLLHGTEVCCFLLLSSIALYGCVTINLFVQPPTFGGHSGSLPLLVIRNKAAIKICLQVFFRTYVFIPFG